MTGEMHSLAQEFGDVLFLDAKLGGGNTAAWPFWGPTVLDEENCPRRIAHCLTYTESNEIANWILRAILDLVPSLETTLFTVFTDGRVSEATVKAVFPNVAHFLCPWHICVVDLPRKLAREPLLQEVIDDVRDCLVGGSHEDQFHRDWARIMGKLTVAGQEYMGYWYRRREQWAGYSRAREFTMLREGNTTAEQTNSVVARALGSGKLHLVPFLGRLLDMENRVRNTKLQEMRTTQVHLAARLRDMESEVQRECFREQGDFAADQFVEQLEQSKNYKVVFSAHQTVATLTRQGYPRVPRRLELDENGVWTCTCGDWCQVHLACRHVIAVLNAVTCVSPP